MISKRLRFSILERDHLRESRDELRDKLQAGVE
jgi:hypothetical protein